MNERKQSAITREHICRTMREMILEAPREEVRDLAREAGHDAQQLAKAGRNAAERALREFRQSVADIENTSAIFKSLNYLLVMLRRRDNLDEAELAQKAQIEEAEIRRIELEPGYIPAPRTIYKLENIFKLPSGVLGKLSGAIKHHSPTFEERALEFAANAKSIGKLTREEKQLLNEFIKFLKEKG
jgi:ribosome-binding protein aMBF1 (putative translation factor)